MDRDQFIIERNKGLARTWIPLPAASAEELAINSA
jgi:hypothetical protein